MSIWPRNSRCKLLKLRAIWPQDLLAQYAQHAAQVLCSCDLRCTERDASGTQPCSLQRRQTIQVPIS